MNELVQLIVDSVALGLVLVLGPPGFGWIAWKIDRWHNDRTANKSVERLVRWREFYDSHEDAIKQEFKGIFFE